MVGSLKTRSPLLLLGLSTLLALTACTGGQSTASAPSSTAEPSTSTSAPATASASARQTASPSPEAASPSPAEASPSPEATASPEAEAQAAASPAPPSPPVTPGRVITVSPEAEAEDPASPSPSASVITVPAPGNTGGGAHNPQAAGAQAAHTAACNYSAIHIAAEVSNGAAGSRYITLTYTNTGAAPCSLVGWPSVSYVDGSGQPIGAPAAPAAEWTSSGEIVAPGSSAQATLREARANLYGDACQAVTAAGYRVGIPGTDQSLVLALPAEACSNKALAQLSVGQVGAHP